MNENEIIGVPDRREDLCSECGRWDGHYSSCSQVVSTITHGDKLLVRSRDGKTHVLPIETR